jgi:hypothetical protein
MWSAIDLAAFFEENMPQEYWIVCGKASYDIGKFALLELRHQRTALLQGAMAGIWARFDQSFIQAPIDLAETKADLPGRWNTTWTNPANDQITVVWSFASPEFIGRSNTVLHARRRLRQPR